MSDKADIGKRIRMLRTERGFSQAELATRLGYTSRSSINKIECGKNAVQAEMVSEFARVLQTTPAYLLGSLEEGLRVLGVNTYLNSDGTVELHDEMRGARLRFTPELWRHLEETDAFATVWDRMAAVAHDKGEPVLVTSLDVKTPAPVAEDRRSEIQTIFDQLSPANQSKLIELSRLYLASQSKTEETK